MHRGRDRKKSMCSRTRSRSRNRGPRTRWQHRGWSPREPRITSRRNTRVRESRSWSRQSRSIGTRSGQMLRKDTGSRASNHSRTSNRVRRGKTRIGVDVCRRGSYGRATRLRGLASATQGRTPSGQDTSTPFESPPPRRQRLRTVLACPPAFGHRLPLGCLWYNR